MISHATSYSHLCVVYLYLTCNCNNCIIIFVLGVVVDKRTEEREGKVSSSHIFLGIVLDLGQN